MHYLNRCQTSSYVAEVEQSKVVNLRHRRLGHLSNSSMQQLRNMVTGVNNMDRSVVVPCEACVKRKRVRVPLRRVEINVHNVS